MKIDEPDTAQCRVPSLPPFLPPSLSVLSSVHVFRPSLHLFSAPLSLPLLRSLPFQNAALFTLPPPPSIPQVSLNIYYSYVGQINPKFQYSE